VKIIRFYDEEGKHNLSLIAESDYCPDIDLADPDGKVEYCGVPEDLFLAMSKHFIIEEA